MKAFNIEESIEKYVKSNPGTSVEEIIDFLDYVNKVRYSEAEVSGILLKLAAENKVLEKSKLWY